MFNCFYKSSFYIGKDSYFFKKNLNNVLLIFGQLEKEQVFYSNIINEKNNSLVILDFFNKYEKETSKILKENGYKVISLNSINLKNTIFYKNIKNREFFDFSILRNEKIALFINYVIYDLNEEKCFFKKDVLSLLFNELFIQINNSKGNLKVKFLLDEFRILEDFGDFIDIFNNIFYFVAFLPLDGLLSFFWNENFGTNYYVPKYRGEYLPMEFSPFFEKEKKYSLIYFKNGKFKEKIKVFNKFKK